MNNEYLKHVADVRKIEYSPGFFLTVPRSINCNNTVVNEAGTFPNGERYYERKYVWVNGLYHGVWLKHRDGTIIYLPPEPFAQGFNSLICTVGQTNRYIEHITHESKYHATNITGDAPKSYQVAIEAVDKKRETEPQNWMARKRTVSINKKARALIHDDKILLNHDTTKMFQEYRWTIDELNDCAGIYLHEMDVVVHTSAESAGSSIHPYGVLKDYIEQIKELHANLTLSMCINDHGGHVGKYYVDAAGSIFEVPRICDLMRPEGFFIYRTPNVGEKTDNKLIIVNFKTLEEAIKGNLIRSEVEIRAKAEALALEEKLRIAQATQQNEKTLRSFEEAKRAIEDRTRQDQIQREEMNRRYEREILERTNNRRDSFDIVKIAVSGFATLFPIFYKLFSGK